jgi:hypothetical protein
MQLKFRITKIVNFLFDAKEVIHNDKGFDIL